MANEEDDDLIGFRDFIEGEDSRFLKRAPQRKRKTDDFELVTFLEQESNRLGKQIDMLEEKVYVLKNYPQFPTLAIEAETENIEERIKVIDLCSREDSPFHQNLEEIFSKFFK